jgi:hypothetical protein
MIRCGRASCMVVLAAFRLCTVNVIANCLQRLYCQTC